jgi:hypothetical protein
MFRVVSRFPEVFQIFSVLGVEPLEFVTGRTYVRHYGLVTSHIR